MMDRDDVAFASLRSCSAKDHRDPTHRGAMDGPPEPRCVDFIRRSCYIEGMTAKDKAIQVLQDLPEDASFEDAMERLLFLAKIERGLEQADAGQTISHTEMKDRMGKLTRRAILG